VQLIGNWATLNIEPEQVENNIEKVIQLDYTIIFALCLLRANGTIVTNHYGTRPIHNKHVIHSGIDSLTLNYKSKLHSIEATLHSTPPSGQSRDDWYPIVGLSAIEQSAVFIVVYESRLLHNVPSPASVCLPAIV